MPPTPSAARVTRARTVVVARLPRYGTKPPMKTSTPSGPANGTPSTNRIAAANRPSVVAMTDVPRR